ncbi:MAG: lipopolysaccharide biosynthesis protein [Candidatus Accumulibacter sp.]|uniref:Lipopolysaccharide biosynthesis protein n=1 Tax=Candidatus Accumulibacter proximus TaxID=2954385 RepID=A0A935PXP9_9PROT|nr:lipopolysaccharide biosynthesis protein [Candidatus Accumulibacter proximus]
MKTKFVQGAVWMICMRWAIRCAGLVSTLILARILTPADFGIVAMSSLVSGLLDIILELGTWQVLLRMRHADRQAYDTAWTITLIQSILLAVIVYFVAYPAALYFHEPRLVAVMQVLAAGSVIGGLGNIGIIMFRRDLDFKSDFLVGFYSKVLAVIPTIILALVFRSYWALVAGTIIGTALAVIVSYVMHPFRPRLRLSEWRQFTTFATWMTPAGIANFLNQKADVFVVGYVANTAQLGAYNVASELSRMATAEIVIPMARAIYPNYAKLKDNLDELTSAFLIVLRTVGIVTFSAGFGIAAVADDLVHVVLGKQWGFAVPLIEWLGVFGTFAAIQSTIAGHILIVLNRERTVFVISWLRLGVFGSSILVAAWAGTVVDVAIAGTLSTAAFTVGCLLYLPKVLPVSATRILRDFVRILLTALAMFAVVKALHSHEIESHFVTLFIDVATGAAVFSLILYVSWIAEGRPDGPENRIINLVSGTLERFRGIGG